jgi:hypothetical protein
MRDADYMASLHKMDKMAGQSSSDKRVVIWDGTGNSSHWLFSRGVIKNRFEALNCWKLIDPGEPADWVDGNPVEETFTIPQPNIDEMVNNVLVQRREQLRGRITDGVHRLTTLWRGKANYDLHDEYQRQMREGMIGPPPMPFSDVNPHVPGFEELREYYILENKRQEELANIDTKEANFLEDRYLRAVEHYKAELKEFVDKQNKTLGLFMDLFGMTARAHVDAFIEQKRFKKAWVVLDEKYGINSSGNTGNAVETLTNIVWRVDDMAISEYFRYVDNLILEAAKMGTTFAPGVAMYYAKAGLEKSSIAGALKMDLAIANSTKMSYEAFKIHMEETMNKARDKLALDDLLQPKASKESVNSVQGGTNKDLSHIQCYLCKEWGHYSNQCPESKGGGPGKGNKGRGKNNNKFKPCPTCGKMHKGVCRNSLKEKAASVKNNKQRSQNDADDQDLQDEDNVGSVKAGSRPDLTSTFKKKLGKLNSLKIGIRPSQSTSGLTERDQGSDDYRWIIDSGATSHMSPYLELFHKDSLRPYRESVSLPDFKTSLDVEGKGQCGALQEVFYVPTLGEGIVSVPTLEVRGCTVVFKNKKAIVYDRDDQIFLTGSYEGGLYYLDEEYITAMMEFDGLRNRLNVLQRVCHCKPGVLCKDCIKQRLEDKLDENIRQMNGKRDASSLFYEMCSCDDRNQQQEASSNVRSDGSNVKKYKSVYLKDPLLHLHNCWGHLNVEAIKRAIRDGAVIGHGIDDYKTIMKEKPFLCVDCAKGKMTEFSMDSSTTDHKAREAFDLLATDDKGAFSVRSVNHYVRFDLFIFDTSHWMVVKFKRNKREFLENLKTVLEEIDIEFQTTVKYLQSDDENIYSESSVDEYLRKMKIAKLTSAPYKKQMNGFCERAMRTLVEKTKTIMSVYNCPLRFWDYAVQTACYLYNVSPHSALDYKTPYEKVHGRAPDISNLVPFYAPGVYFLTPDERETGIIHKHAEECRMLGYVKGSKNSYYIWIPSKRSILVRHDCVFDERLGVRDVPSQVPLEDRGNFRDLTADEEAEENIRGNEDFFEEVANSDVEEIPTEEILEEEYGWTPYFEEEEYNPLPETEVVESQEAVPRVSPLGEVSSIENPVFQEHSTAEPSTLDENSDDEYQQPSVIRENLDEAEILVTPYEPPILYRDKLQRTTPVSIIKRTNLPIRRERNQSRARFHARKNQMDHDDEDYDSMMEERMREIINLRRPTGRSTNHGSRNGFRLDDREQQLYLRPMVMALHPSDIMHCLGLKVERLCAIKKRPMSLNLPPIPKDEREALSGPWREKWIEAIIKETTSLDENATFEDAPYQKNAAKSKFVFDVTLDNNGDIKFKARLVLLGYSQIKHVNYDETYAPTIMKATLFLCLNYFIRIGWMSAIEDVGSAFLLGENDFDIYMGLPLIVSPGDKARIVKVLRSLYGEKQAAWIWYNYANNGMIALGFVRSIGDNCLYMKYNGNGELIMIVCLHVDDFLVMAKTMEEIEAFSESMKKEFNKVRSYADYKLYLGIYIDRETKGQLELHQSVYIEGIEKALMELPESNPMSKAIKMHKEIPMSPMFKYSAMEKEERKLSDSSNADMYDWAGRFRFLADRTRPDILVALGILSSDLKRSSEKTLIAFQSLASYIVNTPDDKIVFKNTGTKVVIFAMCDASYNASGDGKCRLGAAIFAGPDSGAYHAVSFLDTTVSHSACEGEIKVIDYIAREIVNQRVLLKELGHEQIEPTVIFTDSKSSIELLNCLKSKNNLKHISPKVAYIRELINSRVIELCFVSGEVNVADILTKPVAKERFVKLKEWLLKGIPASVLNEMISSMKVIIHNKPNRRDYLFYEEIGKASDK